LTTKFLYLGTIKEIKVMNKHIKNTIEQVSNSFPSLFSREDVIKLLTDLNAEMQSSPQLVIEKDALIDIFRETFSDKDFRNVVSTDDIELSLSYNNKIEIENVPIDEDEIISSAVDALEASWDSLMEAANEED
jgi:hypothetical protein